MDTGVIGSEQNLLCARERQTNSPLVSVSAHRFWLFVSASPAFPLVGLSPITPRFISNPCAIISLAVLVLSVWVVMCSAAVQCVQPAAPQWLTCPFFLRATHKHTHRHQLDIYTRMYAVQSTVHWLNVRNLNLILYNWHALEMSQINKGLQPGKEYLVSWSKVSMCQRTDKFFFLT